VGKTPVPLLVVVDDEFVEHPKIFELERKGHTVASMSELRRGDLHNAQGPDLILSRAAWNWDDEMWRYLEVTLKAARQRKKEARDAAV
jgi:hypothetical protein